MTRAVFMRPYGLVLPAVGLFFILLLLPVLGLVVLSLQDGGATGDATSNSLHNYLAVLTDAYYQRIFAETIRIAVIVSIVCVSLGTWAALVLHRLGPPWRSILLLLCLSPLLISVVVRTMGWALLLGPTGLLNVTLMRWHVVAQPIRFMYTTTGVVIALIHVLLPFAVISVWTALERLPRGIESAALSLGANRAAVLRRVTLPLAAPGILSATLIVFALSLGAFATPAIIGGGRVKTAATAAYDEFLTTLNWPLGAALSMVLLVLCALALVTLNIAVERRMARRS